MHDGAYISMRGSDYERIPAKDSFESDNKKRKTVLTAAGVLSATVLIVGGICLHKGGKALEGQNANFGEKLKAGWKMLRGKDVKPQNEKPGNSPKPDETKRPEEAKEPEKPATEAKNNEEIFKMISEAYGVIFPKK